MKIALVALTLTVSNNVWSQTDGSFKAYNNYDFVAGENILFEDHFTDDQDGEFPTHWKLTEGQAVVNTIENERAVAITKYYTEISLRMKTATYLPQQYTVEFDAWLDGAYDSNPGVGLNLNIAGSDPAKLTIDHSLITLDFPGGKLQGDIPSAISMEAFHNKWHHFAIAVNDKQMKIYCDQYRVLVVPDDNMTATTISVWGNASDGMNMLFKNFKLAQGGGMNVIGKTFTDSKIVTHGILFDYNSSTIKPQSMGVLKSIVQVMTDNPTLKFEVGGYTDSDGDDAYNLKLSQQRADAVKAKLVSLGISTDRLTTKGYGESNPISDNTSSEGKANNRRVEFVKL